MNPRGVIFILLVLRSIGSVAQSPGPEVMSIRLQAVTGPLRNWTPDTSADRIDIPTRDRIGLIHARDLQRPEFTRYGSRHKGPDPLWQRDYQLPQTTRPLSGRDNTTQGSIEAGRALVDQDLEGIAASNVTPADPTLAVGPDHVIQMVNGSSGSAFFQIFDKRGGTLKVQAFMDQLPGASYNGGGDCIAWFDAAASRWVMTEFGDSSRTGTKINSLIFAVSQTPDPLGSWYLYEFSDTSFFPDYPKFGNATDAWYGVTVDFISNAYRGNSIWAFDKAQMLAGRPSATVLRYRLTHPDYKFYSTAPVSLAGGVAPPAGTPGLFVYLNEDDWTSDPADVDSLGLISFRPDFGQPARSVIRFERSFAVAPFKGDVCASRNCAPSPRGIGYDVIDGRIMNRPWLRPMGSYRSVVANHTVDVDGSTLAGVRWYELREMGGQWSIFQQGTFAPQSTTSCAVNPPLYRFMGAATLSASGQIALGYSSSSESRFASIGFTGRNADDPSGLMTFRETDATIGQFYGTFSNRWGDYNEIVSDPSDDSLFWMTAMYGGSDNRFKTRILSFRLAPDAPRDAALAAIESPAPCTPVCGGPVAPTVRIRNQGSLPLQNLKVSLQIGGGPVQMINWTGNLSPRGEALVSFPAVSVPAGTVTVKAWVSAPNGGSDGYAGNDTALLSYVLPTLRQPPLTENFEPSTFPPAGWSRRSDGSPNMIWTRVTNAGYSNANSAKFDNYQKDEAGVRSDLLLPPVDMSRTDSVRLTFRLAAATYSATISDTLEVWASVDCGRSFQRHWRKSGLALSTLPAYRTTEFTPTATQWREERIDLPGLSGKEQVMVMFRNINRNSNNIYLDDINISGIPLLTLDAGILSVNAPSPILCDGNIEPEVTIVNRGTQALRSLRISWQYDGGPVVQSDWTGNLGFGEQTRVRLKTGTLPAGYRIIECRVSAPNGGTDGNPDNDMLPLAVGVKRPVRLPLSEGFESLSFPPADWNDINPDRSKGWTRNVSAARSGSSSVTMRNFGYASPSATDRLVSPMLTYEDADSVLLEFDMAAAPGVAAGLPRPSDTLDILISEDCGRSFRSVRKYWGMELRTAVPTLDSAGPRAFLPAIASEWRHERIDLTTALPRNGSFLIDIRNLSRGDNDIHLDNVNIYTKTLPARLKRDGYLIAPNPTRGRIRVQIYPNASKVRNIEVLNTIGQQVYAAGWPTGNAPANMELDLRRLPAGIYTVRIHCTDRVISERIVRE
jgi:hypothetical protein